MALFRTVGGVQARRPPLRPHIAIGYFGMGPYDPLDPTTVELDEPAYEKARGRAERLGVDEWERVDVVTVVRLNRATGTLQALTEVRLGNRPR